MYHTTLGLGVIKKKKVCGVEGLPRWERDDILWGLDAGLGFRVQGLGTTLSWDVAERKERFLVDARSITLFQFS